MLEETQGQSFAPQSPTWPRDDIALRQTLHLEVGVMICMGIWDEAAHKLL